MAVPRHDQLNVDIIINTPMFAPRRVVSTYILGQHKFAGNLSLNFDHTCTYIKPNLQRKIRLSGGFTFAPMYVESLTEVVVANSHVMDPPISVLRDGRLQHTLCKSTFLYSAVSSLWDCSNRFKLHPGGRHVHFNPVSTSLRDIQPRYNYCAKAICSDHLCL